MKKDAFATIREEARRTQVLVFAGGMGRRMGTEAPKALLTLNGQPLIDRCVSLFSRCGYSKFTFLLGWGSDRIRNHIGDGSKHGITATYSIDPKEHYGRGGSFLYALRTGRVDPDARSVITYPDDVITDENMPIKVLTDHLYGVRTQRVLASLVLTSGRRWPYGVAEVGETNIITSFVEKPFIQRPTSVGMYIFEPPVYSFMKEGMEIERDLIPKLASLRKLQAVSINSDAWLPINTLKDFDDAERILSTKS
jgi:NDP-sugar pyrophosphorylase family protein